MLTRGNGGQIISNHIDYTKGYTAEYKMAQFERGEYVSINFREYLNGKKELEKGDTVIYIRSSNYLDQLVSAKADLDIAIANLKSQSTAEKEPLIREAESRLKYIEEKIKEQTILYNRTKHLYEKEYATQEEYELLRWSIDLLEIEKKIYKAQIENLRTGVKPEEIKLLESHVEAVKIRLDFLKELESDLLILSPISGSIIHSFSPDTLLTIINSEQILLHSPIKVFDMYEFEEGEIVSVSITGIKEKFEGKVLSVGKEVKFVNNQQAIFISIILDNKDSRFLPGMVLESSLQVRYITLFNHLIRLLTH